MNKISIFGYSGHSYVVIETLLAQGYKIHGYFTKNELNHNPYCLKYLGFEDSKEALMAIKGERYFIGIGENAIRKKVSEIVYSVLQTKPQIVIHPSAYISQTANIADGTLVNNLVSINAQVKIGEGVICNTQCVIEHDCEISEFAHIGPNATLCGGVKVGKGTLIGAGAVILPNVTIGANVIVGAGSIVINNIEDNIKVVGNPAIKI